MKRFSVAIDVNIPHGEVEELITTGIFTAKDHPEIGDFLEIEAKDENGMPFNAEGILVEIVED